MPTNKFAARIFMGLLAVVCLTASAFGASDPRPCLSNAELRQLDYWLGAWKITSPGASASGTSNVHLSLGDCLFIESWDNGKGHTGQNYLGYSPDDKTWYGMFADNQGRVHIFTEGVVFSGSAEFHGRSRGPQGETVLNRIRVVRLAADKVQQTWDKSHDNGGSWKTVFQGEYERASR